MLVVSSAIFQLSLPGSNGSRTRRLETTRRELDHEKSGRSLFWAKCCAFCAVEFSLLFTINMRKNHLFVLGKVQDTGENEGEKVDKNTQGMGSQVSCHKRQKLSSQYDGKSETFVYNCPRTEKIISSKPETAVLKRRRSYSEYDNLTIGQQNVCKKIKVNQLYTDYCGRNSFMAAFFRLLGKYK